MDKNNIQLISGRVKLIFPQLKEELQIKTFLLLMDLKNIL